VVGIKDMASASLYRWSEDRAPAGSRGRALVRKGRRSRGRSICTAKGRPKTLQSIQAKIWHWQRVNRHRRQTVPTRRVLTAVQSGCLSVFHPSEGGGAIAPLPMTTGDHEYTRLPWGRNFYPHTHPIPIPMAPMGIPIPTADLWIHHDVTIYTNRNDEAVIRER